MVPRKTATAKQTPPLLGERRLDRAHLDALYRWLSSSPRTACRLRRRVQADLLAWSPAQRGLDEAVGLDGLWRAIQIVRTHNELAIERPDYDDIEGIEAADAPTLDRRCTWSDVRERLFDCLEIRGHTFRELDLSAYPVAREIYRFDADTLGYVAEDDATDTAAAAIYDDWSWAITRDDDGFAEIAEYAASPAGAPARRLPPRWPQRADRAEILLHYHDADDHLIDRIRQPSAHVLERRVFLLADGVYTDSIRCTYERFAAPQVEPGVAGRVKRRAR